MAQVLVTGGAGYIGSHVVVELLGAGHEVVVLDDLSNGSKTAVERASAIAGRDAGFFEVDLRDAEGVDAVFAAGSFDSVVHLAGLKAVGESVAEPLRYYQVNVGGALNLVDAMLAHDVFRMVFSSSATVYGAPQFLPLTEEHPTSCTNPYGWTKLHQEQIFRDLAVADDRWRIGLLRYFNPVGAHSSGQIGEDPAGTPNNLMPFVMQVAVGMRDEVVMFGDDYDTPDGTGVRDYIHVSDLAEGHLAALDALDRFPGCREWNLGAGRGYSVAEVVAAAEAAVGHEIASRVGPRRDGDIAESVADPTRAKEELGWGVSRDLTAMCEDHWRWQQNNPAGY